MKGERKREDTKIAPEFMVMVHGAFNDWGRLGKKQT